MFSPQHNPSTSPIQASTQPEPTINYSWRESHPNAQLLYIFDHIGANEALAQLGSGPYGLDIEWKPNFVKDQKENKVALIQIANHETILLLQISSMKQFPSKLRNFFLNPNIIKAGAGIQGDAEKLYRDWKVDIKSCVDLTLLARTVDNKIWKGRYNNPLGLAHMIRVYEHRVLVKGKITRSNWENHLTVAQQNYAANDAHAGYTLYTKLIAMLPLMSSQPEAKCYTFDSINGGLRIPSRKTPWQASNPDYDPGPPPPPREPSRSSAIPAAVPTDQTQFPVARGPGSTYTRGSYTHRGRRGSQQTHYVGPSHLSSNSMIYQLDNPIFSLARNPQQSSSQHQPNPFS